MKKQASSVIRIREFSESNCVEPFRLASSGFCVTGVGNADLILGSSVSSLRDPFGFGVHNPVDHLTSTLPDQVSRISRRV